MNPGPMVQDFKTEELRSFLEKGFGWCLSSLVRLPGRTWSLNFRAERESDGLVFVVKCSPVGRGELADFRWHALMCHAEELTGAKVTQRLFKDGPSTFGKYRLLYLSWCAGVRQFPDKLSPGEFSAFVDDYRAFSSAMQHATEVLPPDDLTKLRTNALTALRASRLTAWMGRLLERDIPTEDVTYRQELVRVTHGDLHHGNVHFEQGRVSGFFDLEELRNGYPSQDIIRYVICAGEHLSWISFWRRCRTLRRFEQAVLRLPYSRHEWNLSINVYFLWKVNGRIRNGRIGFFTALNLRYRYAFYRSLRRIADSGIRPPESLRERFGILRGEPIVEYQNPPERIPCNETSDAGRLCRHPLVSVVMTAYNHEKYIGEAIESVMRQRADFEYELLVCEDCSPDATRRICFEYQRRYPDRIRVLWSERNIFGALGGNEARGEAHCRGEYIAYCEGDDYWLDPLKLQKQVAAMREHLSAGMCFGGTNYLQQDIGRLDRFDPFRAQQGDFMSGGEFVSRFLFDREGIYGQNIHTSATLVTREALAAARRRYPDIFSWHLRMRDWTRILSVASVSDVCFVREALSVYRRGNGTGMTQREATRLVMDDNVCRTYFAMFAYGLPLSEALKAFGSRLALQWMKLAAEAKPERQREMARRLDGLPELQALLGRWYLRPFRRALERGSFGRLKFRLCRALLVAGSRPGRLRALAALRRLDLLSDFSSSGKVAVLEVSHKPYGKVPMACVVPVHAGNRCMKFSILIPCLDLAPWIRACLDSVRAQTCGDWECVAVDDGSTDGTSAILDEYAAKDGRFRALHQRNAGVGAARNAALTAARGDWILFLDGDDVLAPSALERVSAALVAHPGVEAVRFGYARFEGSWTADGAAFPPRPVRVDVSQAVPMKALRSYLWQFAFRREAVEGLRFTRYRRGEDRLFVVEALLGRLNGYAEQDEPLYGYRRREGSAMSAQPDRQTLLDELDHRLDVVRMVLAAEKSIDFSDPAWYDWIEDFYVNHRRMLRPVRKEWLERLAELGHLPGLTRRGRRLVRRQKTYRKYGAEGFVSYCRIRLSCLLARMSVHRLFLPKLRARKYGHVIPIGATCEVAFRFYHTWGFLDSSLLSWAGTYTMEQLNAVLRDLPSLLTGDVAFEDRRLMWRCLNTQVDFHGQLKRIGGRLPSDEAKAADLAALRGRVEYLKEKLLRYLRDDEETLLVRRLGLEDVTPDLGERLDELERTIAGLGARNWKLLVVCEEKDIAKMPTGGNRVFRSVRKFNPPDLVTDPDCGDTIGWKAIFTEFAPAKIVAKKHAFKFE